MTYNYIVDIRNGSLAKIQTNIITSDAVNNKRNFEEYPITLAARFKQEDILDFFISIGANVDLVGDTSYAAIHWAVVNNDSSILSKLINANANLEVKQSLTLLGRAIFSTENTALHLAAARDHSTIVQTLIDEGVNLDTQNKLGYTPLHLCVKRDYTVTTQKLIDAGADKTITNNDGLTASNLSTSSEMNTILA